MKTYQVSMETKVSKYVEIEAESAEEAVRIAQRDFTRQTVEVDLSVTWLDDKQKAEETDELCIEYAGRCDNCGEPLLIRRERNDGTTEEDPRDWPWIMGTPTHEQLVQALGPGDSGQGWNRDYFTWCYRCLQHPLRQLADCAE